MLIGQKNAASLAEALFDELDFAVLEDCKGLNEDPEDNEANFYAKFLPYITATPRAKPVFSIEYPTSLRDPSTNGCNPTGTNESEFSASYDPRPETQGFSTVLKIQGNEQELNGYTQYCG
ncbi:hypothetical protein B0T18DRAFT_387047 [Schizothecium vesticola]|uniref:Glycoside-hydrolase family GH114 TIM-barrel domain-containing protein n=1 Tax=Schizothecium vesticola TaxID=314040 RepID=A0AA40F401_9PEZI|nr:hypothetical protein B0T18DRAFT_387047 [Schizothecium vesticola]